MKRFSIRTTAPAVSTKGLGLARRFASEGASAAVGTKYQVSDGYLLQRKVSEARSEVTVIDLPGRVVTTDAVGTGAGGYATGGYGAGGRHSWVEGSDSSLPSPPANLRPVTPRRASLGVDPLLPGYPVSRVTAANYSITGFADTSTDYSFNAPFATLGGPPATPNGGFWRCQFQTAEQKTFADLLQVGEQPDFPAHWISVVTGYTAKKSTLDLRIGPAYVEQLAPGYFFMPPSVGASGSGGSWGGTFPTATACRRIVGGQDLLAVSLPVAKTAPSAAYRRYDTGVSGLLALVFLVEREEITLLRSHLFRLQDLPAAMQIAPEAGLSDSFHYNTACLQSVALTAEGDPVIHGCWITSKYSEATYVDSDGNEVATLEEAVQTVNAGHIPIYHYYRAEVLPTTWAFNIVATKVFLREDIDFDDRLLLDDDPSTPAVPLPYYIASMAATNDAGEEVVTAVAWCQNLDRSLFIFNSLTGPVTGRFYAPDPVSLFVYGPAAFQSEPQVYQTYRSYLGVPTNGFRLGTYPTRVGNNAMYDTRTLLFSGFDRVQFATRIRFLTVDVLTGAVSYDVLPPLNAQYSSYIFTPKVSQYQQVLYSDEDRTEEAIGFGGIVSFSHWTGTGILPRAYVFRNGDVGWEEIPGIAASNEVHYVGNGAFGQCGRLFKENGF